MDCAYIWFEIELHRTGSIPYEHNVRYSLFICCYWNVRPSNWKFKMDKIKFKCSNLCPIIIIIILMNAYINWYGLCGTLYIQHAMHFVFIQWALEWTWIEFGAFWTNVGTNKRYAIKHPVQSYCVNESCLG